MNTPDAEVPETVPVFVISLDRDRLRREHILGQLGAIPGITSYIVDAVKGRSLPLAAALNLVQKLDWVSNKGTIGCFLSHVSAWESIAASDSKYAIVLEDDVDARSLRFLGSFTPPDDAEIIFINDRMSPDEPGNMPFQPVPIWRSLCRLNERREGAGGDGYVLTPASAAKLLAACAKDLFFGHVDGRLLRYAVSEDDLAHMPEDSWISTVIRTHHHPRLQPALGLLKGYTLSSPMIRHRGVSSTREADDQARTSIVSPARKVLPEASIPIRYWSRHRNIGDLINPYIVEAVSDRRPYFMADENAPHVLGVGSIMFMATAHSHIWGSGIMDPSKQYPNAAGSKIHALRGSLTRDLLWAERGSTLKDVPLGDPGIFADEIPEVQRFRKLCKIKYKAAIIPHHDVADHSYYKEMSTHDDCIVVDTRTGSLAFIDAILSSEVVISQSLHGLIFAEIFGKPSVWIAREKNEIWEFKFRDWFTNTLEPPVGPALFGQTLKTLIEGARLSGLRLDRESLREAMPLPIGPDRTGCMAFRECRAKAWMRFRIITDNVLPISADSGYDDDINIRGRDEKLLRESLNVHARIPDELMPALLIFEESTYRSFAIDDVEKLRIILNKHVGAHYIVVLNAKCESARRVDVTPITADDRAACSWRGAVLTRHMINFSYDAPGILVQL